MSTQDSGGNLVHDPRVSPDADQQLLVSVSVHVPASLAVSPDMAGQLLTQVIRAFPTHHAALRANPRFGAAQQTLDAAMVALGYNGNSSDDSDDQLDDDGGIQPVGMVVMSNQYPAPQYPDGFVLGWHHPPPLPTPYPLCCDCTDGQCVAAGTAQDRAVGGACAEVALWRWHVGTFVDAALIVLIVVDAALIARPSGTAWTACRKRY